MRAWCLRCLTILACVPASIAGRSSGAQQIWLAPLPLTVRTDGTVAGTRDYFDMFAPKAPWQSVASKVSVFKIYPELLRSASDDQIRALVAGLADRHIMLALEAPVLAAASDCAPGADHRRWLPALLERLHRLGGQLRKLVMVGPIVDGHISVRAGACRWTLADVAQDAALTVARIRDMFPDVEVGEIEPIGNGTGYLDPAELATWFEDWTRADGHSLAFLHLDVEWGKPWGRDLRRVADEASRHGVPLGVIINASASALSDQQFADQALSHAVRVVQEIGHSPEQLVFQSWEDFPHRALPDTDFTTMTGLIRAYVRTPSLLQATGTGHARLVTASGQPIAGASISIASHFDGSGLQADRLSIQGIVPHTAKTALFVLRVHTECDCVTNAASFTLHDAAFSQSRSATGQSSTVGQAPIASPTFGPFVENVAAGQPRILNSRPFPVTADQHFAASVALSVPFSADHTGIVGLVFLNDADREVRRTTDFLSPSWTSLAQVATDRNGEVTFPVSQSPVPERMRLQFAGTVDYRPTELLMTSSAVATQK